LKGVWGLEQMAEMALLNAGRLPPQVMKTTVALVPFLDKPPSPSSLLLSECPDSFVSNLTTRSVRQNEHLLTSQHLKIPVAAGRILKAFTM
jgi:hypothetical protein